MSDDREIILVIGPACSGVTSVADALRQRCGGYRFVEHLGHTERPAAVVFVVSAAAPLVESDACLLDAAAAHTDAVLAVVSKIDVHRTWPQVLDANRALLADYAARYARLAWVGVAADPHVGEVRVDQLADALRTVLAARLRLPRKLLQSGDSHVKSRTARAFAVRSEVQQSRVRITGQVRTVCMALRTELRNEAAEVPHRAVDEFRSAVHRRVVREAAELDATLTGRLTQLAHGLDLSAPPCPPLESYLPRFGRPRLENRLTVLLSAGFGLGVALTVGRLLADLMPSWTPGVVIGTLSAGIALTGWVIRTRRLLAERSALERWVTEVTAGLRAAMEERVLTQFLAAESALAAAAATGEFRGSAAVPGTRPDLSDIIAINDGHRARANLHGT
jgi:hypothetical protein